MFGEELYNNHEQLKFQDRFSKNIKSNLMKILFFTANKGFKDIDSLIAHFQLEKLFDSMDNSLLPPGLIRWTLLASRNYQKLDDTDWSILRKQLMFEDSTELIKGFVVGKPSQLISEVFHINGKIDKVMEKVEPNFKDNLMKALHIIEQVDRNMFHIPFFTKEIVPFQSAEIASTSHIKAVGTVYVNNSAGSEQLIEYLVHENAHQVFHYFMYTNGDKMEEIPEIEVSIPWKDQPRSISRVFFALHSFINVSKFYCLKHPILPLTDFEKSVLSRMQNWTEKGLQVLEPFQNYNAIINDIFTTTLAASQDMAYVK